MESMSGWEQLAFATLLGSAVALAGCAETPEETARDVASAQEKAGYEIAKAQEKVDVELEAARREYDQTVASAAGDINRQRADLVREQAQALYTIAQAEVQGQYVVQREQCDAFEGKVQDRCYEMAHAVYDAAIARAKADRERMQESAAHIAEDSRNARMVSYSNNASSDDMN